MVLLGVKLLSGQVLFLWIFLFFFFHGWSVVKVELKNIYICSGILVSRGTCNYVLVI